MTTKLTLDPSIADYLYAHRWAILATLNRDGSPQQTMIAYRYDGNDLAISVRASTLKAKNIMRRPAVSIAIPDDRAQVIVRGTATLIRDLDEVAQIHLKRPLLREYQQNVTEAEFLQRLRDEERVVIVIEPEGVFPATLSRQI